MCMCLFSCGDGSLATPNDGAGSSQYTSTPSTAAAPPKISVTHDCTFPELSRNSPPLNRLHHPSPRRGCGQIGKTHLTGAILNAGAKAAP